MNQRYRLAIFALFFMGTQAFGSALKVAVPGCRDEAALKAGLQMRMDTNGKKTAAYSNMKIDSSNCIQLLKGQQVTVDERCPGVWCVRRSADLDCYWTPENAVDLYPPIVSTGGGGGGSGRG